MGMQLFFEHSEEGDTKGLGILPGTVVRVRGKGVKVPHMGWNSLHDTAGFLRGFEGRYFYFVHSYACVPSGGGVAARTTYGGETFASAVAAGSVVGVQFHPEKSSHDGLALLSAALGALSG
jgi:glutamine amidotransferase